MKLKRDVFGHSGIAHSSLRDSLPSKHYTDGTLKRVTNAVTDLRLSPTGARLDRQVLFGHPVCQLEAQQGLSRDETSGYVGYIAPTSVEEWVAPTHRVCVRATLLFGEPDIKTPDPMPISAGSFLSIEHLEAKFARTQSGLYAIASHLAPMDQREEDLAATAKRLLGTPYLWGGNSAFGIDCSGLVQLACQAAGITCPGDSDQQLAELGTSLPEGSAPRRNDLFFWPGHVALAFDEATLIHANGHHMAVALEPVQEALRRIEAQGEGPLLDHKRF